MQMLLRHDLALHYADVLQAIDAMNDGKEHTMALQLCDRLTIVGDKPAVALRRAIALEALGDHHASVQLLTQAAAVLKNDTQVFRLASRIARHMLADPHVYAAAKQAGISVPLRSPAAPTLDAAALVNEEAHSAERASASGGDDERGSPGVSGGLVQSEKELALSANVTLPGASSQPQSSSVEVLTARAPSNTAGTQAPLLLPPGGRAASSNRISVLPPNSTAASAAASSSVLTAESGLAAVQAAMAQVTHRLSAAAERPADHARSAAQLRARVATGLIGQHNVGQAQVDDLVPHAAAGDGAAESASNLRAAGAGDLLVDSSTSDQDLASGNSAAHVLYAEQLADLRVIQDLLSTPEAAAYMVAAAAAKKLQGSTATIEEIADAVAASASIKHPQNAVVKLFEKQVSGPSVYSIKVERLREATGLRLRAFQVAPFSGGYFRRATAKYTSSPF